MRPTEGPTDYLDPSCGILVDIPDSKTAFVERFAEAMEKIIAEPSVREEMGARGFEKIKSQFDWA